jgi:6-pyruvoyltetrahydropterin/6-carboxytetrahydropterin synthase
MFYVSKRMEIAGAHRLSLSYESKCQNLHGHNWIVIVHCKSEKLNADGMVCDFTHIKRDVHDALDHKMLNEIVPFNPTAENIAKWICDRVPNCYKVEMQESEGNVACYEK